MFLQAGVHQQPLSGQCGFNKCPVTSGNNHLFLAPFKCAKETLRALQLNTPVQGIIHIKKGS